MAWEWVAPVATATSGIVGVAFTWLAGYQGRKHAEQVAQQSAQNDLAKAREERRARAYADILTMVYSSTEAVMHKLLKLELKGDEPYSMPGVHDQVVTSTQVNLYGSPAVREAYSKWFSEIVTFIEQGKEVPESERDAVISKINAATGRITRAMNSELTS
ncbi:hypothetical protein FXF51_42740 [Nonomuraea sp. PA05]|uniref:hypothetical protein n=1 Tax=Nonomuraea sp. PA05 TaxID=2604466 RepID=UPI0011D624C8|nr:hypothetical protein [Nonomuraea sp. PA05]TYB56827.1 hypothetical protein FXF51_42740 [Nonomuraea sp. PA05]